MAAMIADSDWINPLSGLPIRRQPACRPKALPSAHRSDGYGCFKAAGLRCAAPVVVPCTVAQQDAGNGRLERALELVR
jgi:hypothetical protein